jgi:hypothetical protein
MLEARRNAVRYLGDADAATTGLFSLAPRYELSVCVSGKCDCAGVVAGKVHCWPWMGKKGFPLPSVTFAEDQGAYVAAHQQGDDWSSSYFLSSEL